MQTKIYPLTTLLEPHSRKTLGPPPRSQGQDRGLDQGVDPNQRQGLTKKFNFQSTKTDLSWNPL